MENEINISSEQINSFLSRLSGNRNVSAETVKESLSQEQKEKINAVLSDPERLKKLLSSPQAKKLFDMMKDKKE
jgi:hypothetical protein